MRTLTEGNSIGHDNGCSQDQPSKGEILVLDTPGQALSLQGEHELKRAAGFAHASKSAATKRAYTTDFQSFAAWCADRKLAALPAECETVCGHLSMLADRGKKTSTIRRALAAITHSHRLRGLEPPQSKAVWSVMVGIP